MAIFLVMPVSGASEELIVKNCNELMRMAENLQEDLKTTNMMLKASLDGGSIQSVKTYKLKKEATSNKLQAVLQAINLKGCAKGL